MTVIAMTVIAPSMGNAAGVSALKAFPGARLWVPEGEAPAYRAYHPPEQVIGCQGAALSALRNAALDAHSGDDVLLLTDDVYGVGVWDANRWRALDVAECLALAVSGFRLCREAGATLWGINPSRNRRAYQTFAPFSLLSIPSSAWSGHVAGSSLRYEPRMGLFDDLDLGLRAIAQDRRVWRMDKYHVLRRETRYRREELEAGARSFQALRGRYGPRVVTELDEERLTVALRIPLAGR